PARRVAGDDAFRWSRHLLRGPARPAMARGAGSGNYRGRPGPLRAVRGLRSVTRVSAGVLAGVRDPSTSAIPSAAVAGDRSGRQSRGDHLAVYRGPAI